MKLTKVHVKNYRSIEDSQEFDIGGVTCLVGKNEAGKTAILQALNTLRPYTGHDAKYDKLQDYPRRFLNDYQARHPKEPATVIVTTWQMDESDKDALESEFGTGFVTSNEVRITGRYESAQLWTLPVNEQKTIEYLVSKHALDAADEAPIKTCKTTRAAHAALTSVEEKTEKQSLILKDLAAFRDKSVTLSAVDLLSKRTPRFLYFSHYDRMAGQVSIERMRDDANYAATEGNRVFLDFLQYAGTSLNEISSATRYEELNSRCEAASNSITDQLLEYWTQNPYLEVVIQLTKAEPNDEPPFNAGTVSRARVRNTLHRVTVPFSERSAGFIWFFSFLVKFAQVKKECGNVIILLDEPGLTLHGKAQSDLLRYFRDKLEPYHQVIYSTHSPFMVPIDGLETVRIVEDVIDTRPARPIVHGTKVSADIMATDPDTLFPLQGALGYDLAQHLFVAPHNLVVEGTSDFTYLTVLSRHLLEVGRTGLDPKWSVIPVGGADLIPTFVALLGAHLNVTALVDSQKAGHQKLMRLADHGLMKRKRIIMIGDVLGRKLADIEDVFSVGDYLMLFNTAFKTKLKVNDITGTDPLVPRIARNIGKEFDHGLPADVFLRERDKLLPKLSSDTLDRFEKLFLEINATLTL